MRFAPFFQNCRWESGGKRVSVPGTESTRQEKASVFQTRERASAALSFTPPLEGGVGVSAPGEVSERARQGEGAASSAPYMPSSPKIGGGVERRRRKSGKALKNLATRLRRSLLRTRERRRRMHRVRSTHGGTPPRPGIYSWDSKAPPRPGIYSWDSKAPPRPRIYSWDSKAPLRPGIYSWDSKTSMSRVFFCMGLP